MPESSSIIQLVSDLGAGLGSLIACFWYIQFITRSHREERTTADQMHKEERLEWMRKDTSSDEALRGIISESNKILGDLRACLTEQTTLLKAVLEKRQ